MKFFLHSVSVVAVIVTLLLFASPPNAAEIDGVMMRNGKMMIVKHGKPAMPLDDDITVGDGTVVSADGTIKLKGGREFRMKNGQMMMRDGHLMNGGKATGMEPEPGSLVTPKPLLRYPD